MNRELEAETFEDDDVPVKSEALSPVAFRSKKKKTKVVKRLVERPKTVYERFPAFEKGKVLDFTELFKGRVVPKPRIGKRPLTGKIYIFLRPHLNLECLE